MTPRQRRRFAFEFIRTNDLPEDNPVPHLVIQCTVPNDIDGLDQFWLAFDAANMAAYVKGLLEAIHDMGEPYRSICYEALEKFVDERIVACEKEEEEAAEQTPPEQTASQP